MISSIFGMPKSYSEMLNRIALFAIICAAVLIFVLRRQVGWIDKALGEIDFLDRIDGLPEPWSDIPGCSLAVITVVFIISRVLVLHDRLSDLLGIRKRFDAKEILIPMALNSGVQLDDCQESLVKRERHKLMRTVFYRYASSDPKKTQIDTTSTHYAFDRWAWFWIFLEASFFTILSAMFLILTPGARVAGAVLWCVVAVFIIIMVLLYQQTKKYARVQVELILDDQERKESVAGAFKEILE